MRAYSSDLRNRILHAVDQGQTRTEIVDLFQVSQATIGRYVKQRRETGEVKAKPIPGRPAKKRVPLEAHLFPQLQAHPDATMQEHCHLWEANGGEPVSRATMTRAVQRLDWTRKKRRSAPVSRVRKPEPLGEPVARGCKATGWSLWTNAAPILP